MGDIDVHNRSLFPKEKRTRESMSRGSFDKSIDPTLDVLPRDGKRLALPSYGSGRGGVESLGRRLHLYERGFGSCRDIGRVRLQCGQFLGFDVESL